MLPDERWLLVTTVLLRTLLIIALSLEYGLILFDVKSSRVTTLHRRASIALLVCVAVSLCALVYPLGQAYLSSRRQAEVYGPVSALVEMRSSPGDSAASNCSFQDLGITSATSRTHPGAWPRASQRVSTISHTAAGEHAHGPERHHFPRGEVSRYYAHQE
jgi:hypothetical protein